jgi:hypothetical protein
MDVLLTQSWDIVAGKEEEYSDFISNTFLPGISAAGLVPVGGYYVEVGFGPRIVAVHRASGIDGLSRSMGDRTFREMVRRVKSLVYNYRAALLEPTGRVRQEGYAIQKGVWKLNQYYDLRPGMKKEYDDFVVNVYIPAIESLGYVEVTGGWNVTFGGVSEIIGELTFKDPVDIGRMLGSEDFRRVAEKLQEDLVTNYQNRILRCTERFEEHKWFRL